MTLTLYHGTSAEKAESIMQNGFQPSGNNWKVESRDGFVYLSIAYAPFFAERAGGVDSALIKVEVEKDNLYPDDDYLMLMLGKRTYTKEELDAVDVEYYKHYWNLSLANLGCACVKPEHVKIIGVMYFDSSKLVYVSDPTITPINYAVMGQYYRDLSDKIYSGITVDELIKQMMADKDAQLKALFGADYKDRMEVR